MIFRSIKNLPKKIWIFIRLHKKTSAVAFIIIAGLGWYGWTHLSSTSTVNTSTVVTVGKSTIRTTVSGSGQVSASTQIDVKSEVSGDVLYIGVASGDTVKAGQLIARIDSTDAEKTVRDAEISLDSAKLSLQKLEQPADTLSLLQGENALSQAETNLVQSYDDGFNDVSSSFLNLPSVMSGLYNVIYGTDVRQGQYNVSAYSDMINQYDTLVVALKNNSISSYESAKIAYDKTYSNYQKASRFDDEASIEALVKETYATTKQIASAVKATSDLLNFVKEKFTTIDQNAPSALSGHISSTTSYTSSTNQDLQSLLGATETITNAKYSLKEKQQSFDNLKAGTDALDLQSSEISVQQRQYSLDDAKAKLADYYIRASFDGVLAALNINKVEPVSSGSTVATLITTQEIAEISLNEVDIAKVSVGQDAVVTFDAIDGLTVKGKVVEIDTIGTVSQGVVTYNVKVSFDSTNAEIRPGMSANVEIVSASKDQVIVVPSSAVKTVRGKSYVEVTTEVQSSNSQRPVSMVLTKTPEQREVTVGLVNDTMSEITSGLEVGEMIVSQTNSTTATTATAMPTQGGGALFGGGGGMRIRQ
jgi:RND family efflux transporter MFP subunit